MKKKAATRGAAKKSTTSPRDVEAYVAKIPKQSRHAFDELRSAVRSAVPRDATETISYNIPALKLGKVLVWYAAFAKHVSLFPKAAAIEQFKDELKGYSVSKGTIQFPIDKRIPTALVKKIVKARVAQLSE